MEFEEVLKMVYSACEKMNVRSDYTESAIIKSATDIFLSDKNPIRYVNDEPLIQIRKFLETYKDFLLNNTANQHEYNTKIAVVNDIKNYLDGRFKF